MTDTVLRFNRTQGCTNIEELRDEPWLLRRAFGFATSIAAHALIAYLIYINRL